MGYLFRVLLFSQHDLAEGTFSQDFEEPEVFEGTFIRPALAIDQLLQRRFGWKYNWRFKITTKQFWSTDGSRYLRFLMTNDRFWLIFEGTQAPWISMETFTKSRLVWVFKTHFLVSSVNWVFKTCYWSIHNFLFTKLETIHKRGALRL